MLEIVVIILLSNALSISCVGNVGNVGVILVGLLKI